jgi:hypothetical protein
MVSIQKISNECHQPADMAVKGALESSWGFFIVDRYHSKAVLDTMAAPWIRILVTLARCRPKSLDAVSEVDSRRFSSNQFGGKTTAPSSSWLQTIGGSQ